MSVLIDEIWGDLRFHFIADHKAYKALKIYDFPQKNYKSRIINQILMFMSRFPVIRKEIYNNKMKTSMISSLKKIVDEI